MTYLVEQLGQPHPQETEVVEYSHGWECQECGREFDSYFDADLCEAECLAGRVDFAGVTV